ncbi:terminase family protein [Sphingomonas sp. BN140010]|uniref:Terminase family protein n=1 Tax=Sphingomonas arvum TaxID=2992113 RepID=A0ABT3JHL6_9SPHN|nr:terminase family protein [Sphingomonas sp. BN140010]MCW3798266.1 terminase family protein [Sphingomonas sp. BN140010]
MPGMSPREVNRVLRRAALLCRDDPAAWTDFIVELPPSIIDTLKGHWGAGRGRTPQLAPDGNWRLWVIQAGRGFGKTRAGAEWVHSIARMETGVRVALVAASREEAVRVMVEGESGLLATSSADWRPEWLHSRGELEWPSGAIATVYSAAAPEALRGPQHHVAWCDELGKWGGGGARAWDNLTMGLRLGERPQVLVTTTPRGGSQLLKRVLAEPGIVTSKGSTFDNPHLPVAFVTAMEGLYGNSRLGRQELAGELLEEVEGSLFPPALLARQRAERPGAPARVVVGVDPPASAGGTCGIVVAASDEAGQLFVLHDGSVSGRSPEGWARAVADAATAWDADRVVAESNMGGAMVRSVLEQAAPALPLTLVNASRGKVARAEPVAVAFESGRAWLAGRFPELETELERLVPGEVPDPSPDRADAMVWALTALLERRAAPSLRTL